MHRCIELAQLARGHTAPNPMVGAVLVYQDRIIGEGWHHQYGGVHAEVDCLNNVQESDRPLIRSSTMYINLEPCAHHGHTPPCAERLVAENIKEVIVADTDPHSRVAGKGIEILNQGGIEVTIGLMKEHGAWVNRRFLCYHQQSRPYIILKWAQTGNGFIASQQDERLQITNGLSNKLVHKWRTEEAAIMVGYNTALGDNPQLTARLWQGNQPLRIVMDRDLKLPATHYLFNGDATTWVVNNHKESTEGSNQFLQIPYGSDTLRQLMGRLHDARILSLIVEGGAGLLHQFINVGLWDEARILTGNIAIDNGISAPTLTNAKHAFSTNIGDDGLDIYVNRHSAYQYIQGMPL
ncbi:MAG: bifunctional diaminohydroxyphosphoribosylaminopyrimidine deaminase/5-amino-6-(5-phosphoribosylamino)uracil reductase RibD [Taibaiella sp.]|nr:bifunctional diaminohydroxyphosphoribosylaminopyrimidine deaminase/5-amino-6-(5-phosphoribosylamino)uracil reductase RibD [Taibaiella sp.]